MTRHAFEYDAIVIGAGAAGVRCARTAEKNGAKVALVELPFGYVASDTTGGAGGTSVIRGCLPKKLLMYGSAFSQAFEDARAFGWQVRNKEGAHWQHLLERKNATVEDVHGVYEAIFKSKGIDRVKGFARFKDPHTVAVHNAQGDVVRTMSGASVVIATGAAPRRIEFPGAELAITSDDAFALEARPNRVAIVGGGPVAVELAGIFAGLGSEVEVVFRKALPLTGFDEDCRRAVHSGLARRAKVRAECTPVRLDRQPAGDLRLTYANRLGEESTVDVDAVLLATGREPRTAGLDLEVGCVQKARLRRTEGGGLWVGSDLQTSQPHIFAAGDVTGRARMLTPVCLMEGTAVGMRCAPAEATSKPAPTPPVNYSSVPSAVFCQPPLATVGRTEEEAAAEFAGDLSVYLERVLTMPNALNSRNERTLLKMIVHDDTDRVVGVHMVGPGAPDAVQGVAVAMTAGVTKAHFDATAGVHPTPAEDLTQMKTKVRTVAGRGSRRP